METVFLCPAMRKFVTMNEQPIGLFDSGVGGLTIWAEVVKLLPYEDTVYLADTKNSPYGQKYRDTIIELSVKNTERLLQEECKIIVVACNTATTNAIDYLRANYEIPFIGIEPAIKPAALNSTSKTVGVLATKGTLSSELFHHTATNHAAGITIIEKEGKGLVEMIESGKGHSLETRQHLKELLQPMLDQGIDHLVLGCTHYPFLIPVLREILPAGVTIVDCGQAIARQTRNILESIRGLRGENTARHRIIGNGDLELLTQFAGIYPKEKIVEYEDF